MREAQEESGLEAQRLFVLPYVSHFYSERRDAVVAVPVFGIIAEENAQAQLSHEHEEFDWLEVSEAIQRCVIPAQRDAIQLFDQILKNSLGDSDFLRVYELNR